ncbi:hypothetical protein JCM8547_007534, partial [Rhodosporidiobolus lusitaniae]
SVKASRRLLKRCSLVNRLFRNCAQHLLFKHYSRLRSAEDLTEWLGLAASQATEALMVALPAEEGDEVPEWLASRPQEDLLASVLCRSQQLTQLDLHATGVDLARLLTSPSLKNLTRLRVTANGYRGKADFVDPLTPPAFNLDALEMDAFTSPLVLTYLVSSVSHVCYLAVGLADYREEDPVTPLIPILLACKNTLAIFSL